MEKFTGLTLSEQMKLKKLKKSLAGDNGNSGKQISTQQTITFDKMYHDGICKVKKNYYTKYHLFECNNNCFCHRI